MSLRKLVITAMSGASLTVPNQFQRMVDGQRPIATLAS